MDTNSEPNYFNDIQTVQIGGLAHVLFYLGFDLVRIKLNGRKYDYQFVIPKKELVELQRDYDAGNCNIHDAKAFCHVQGAIFVRMKHARVSGDWVNGELVALAKTQGFSI